MAPGALGQGKSSGLYSASDGNLPILQGYLRMDGLSPSTQSLRTAVALLLLPDGHYWKAGDGF